MFELIQKDTYSCIIHVLLMSINLQVFYQELSFIHVLMLNVTLFCLTWIDQFYGHLCMHLDGQLSPSCQPKKFPTPSTKIFPVSPPYLPISFMLFQVCLSCYIVLSTFLNLNAYVIDCHGKNWLKALTNLMHNLLLLHLISMNHCD